MKLNLDREDVMDAITDGVQQVSNLHLNREDVMDAITEGVRSAFAHIGLYDAVREGVNDAIWQMITNATAAPCSDFYETVKECVRDGFMRLRRDQGE